MIGLRTAGPAGALVCLVVALSGCGSTASTDPATEAPMPTYRQTQEEFILGWVACLQDKGYAARATGDGGVQIDGATDRQRVQADSRACKEAMDPARLLPPPPLTASQLEAMYRYVVAQTECMREAGYPVTDPPPFEVYVDTNRAFDPYGDLRQRGVHFTPEDLYRCQRVDERPDFVDF
jgi:hypothetical protein